jgi:hypothetical protein
MQALSVAVNQPKILPPTMMSGVVSAGTETRKLRTTWAIVARG